MGTPRGRVVKAANLQCSKSLVISPLWVLAWLGSRETSQALLAGGQVVFLGDLPFSPHLTTDLAQNK